VARLVERAQAAGTLRPDFSATDVPLIAFLLASVAEYAGPVQPDIWRRYLALIVDGMRASRDGVSELPVAALTPEEIERSMRAHGERSTTRR